MKTNQTNTSSDNVTTTTNTTNPTSEAGSTANNTQDAGNTNGDGDVTQEVTLPNLVVVESKLEKTSKLKDVLNISISSNSTTI